MQTVDIFLKYLKTVFDEKMIFKNTFHSRKNDRQKKIEKISDNRNTFVMQRTIMMEIVIGRRNVFC